MIVDILKSPKKQQKIGNFICFHQAQNKDN